MIYERQVWTEIVPSARAK